jgi:hypothetical protein
MDHEVLRIEMESAMGDDFPTMLLGQIAKDLEDATGLMVRTTVSKGRSLGRAPPPQQRIST